MIRRLKSDVLKELPPKFREKVHISIEKMYTTQIQTLLQAAGISSLD